MKPEKPLYKNVFNPYLQFELPSKDMANIKSTFGYNYSSTGIKIPSTVAGFISHSSKDNKHTLTFQKAMSMSFWNSFYYSTFSSLVYSPEGISKKTNLQSFGKKLNKGSLSVCNSSVLGQTKISSIGATINIWDEITAAGEFTVPTNPGQNPNVSGKAGIQYKKDGFELKSVYLSQGIAKTYVKGNINKHISGSISIDFELNENDGDNINVGVKVAFQE